MCTLLLSWYKKNDIIPKNNLNCMGWAAAPCRLPRVLPFLNKKSDMKPVAAKWKAAATKSNLKLTHLGFFPAPMRATCIFNDLVIKSKYLKWFNVDSIKYSKWFIWVFIRNIFMIDNCKNIFRKTQLQIRFGGCSLSFSCDFGSYHSFWWGIEGLRGLRSNPYNFNCFWV